MSRRIVLAVFILLYLTAITILYGFETSNGEFDPLISFKFSSPMAMDNGLFAVLGLGCLSSTVPSYRLSGVGFTLALACQAMLLYGLTDILFTKAFQLGFDGKKAAISYTQIGRYYHAAAACAVGMSSVMGQQGLLEILVGGLPLVGFYSLNEMLLHGLFKVVDLGTMTVFLYGSTFALVYHKLVQRVQHQRSVLLTYDTGMTALLGAIICWIFFPSFYAIMTSLKPRQLAITNTLFTQLCGNLLLFALIILEQKKMSLECLARASLAAGIAAGANVQHMFNGLTPMVLGIATAAAAYKLDRITRVSMPALGMYFVPAVIGCLYSLVMIGIGAVPYGADQFPLVDGPLGRRIGLQIAGIVVSMALGAAAGALAGLLARLVLMDRYENYLLTESVIGLQQEVSQPIFYNDFAEWDIDIELHKRRDQSERSLKQY